MFFCRKFSDLEVGETLSFFALFHLPFHRDHAGSSMKLGLNMDQEWKAGPGEEVIKVEARQRQ